METSSATTVHYIPDTRASQFTVQVFAGGLLAAFGHNPTIAIRDFCGEAQMNLEELDRSSLKITIQAASLEVRDDISDKDRREIERTMHQEILEIEAYPEIVYECSNIVASPAADGQFSLALNGKLTMLGITRSQTVSARVSLTENALRAFGNFSVMQSFYNLKLASVAGGALKVKDELKFSFNILARKKE